MSSGDSPKVFVSYAWSSPDHEQWVLDLCQRLVEASVDIILDKWDLREGQNSYQFMERIVNDSAIRKVIIISDRIYAEKSNDRRGGAGTEAQIISPKLYSGKDEGRFALVVRERSESGEPFVPTYYHGRIFIDMSTDELADSNLEQLLRWIFDKPLHQRPPLGTRPSFLTDEPEVGLGTEFTASQFRRAARGGSANSANMFREYLECFCRNLDRFAILDPRATNGLVVKQFEALRQAKDEFVRVVLDAVDHESVSRQKLSMHLVRFFDDLLARCYPAKRDRESTDHFKLLAHELFVSVVGIAIWREEFELAKSLLAAPYFGAIKNGYRGGQRDSYAVFWQGDDRLKELRTPEGSEYHTPFGQTLQERASSGALPRDQFLQADLLIHLRAELANGDDRWYPLTWIYVGHHRALEVFIRAQSAQFFGQLKEVLGIESLDPIRELVTSNGPMGYGRIRLGSNVLSYAALMLPDAIATRR